MKYILLLFPVLLTVYPGPGHSYGIENLAYLMKAELCVQPPSSVQCSGKTKSGNRCGNRTKNQSGYCYLHEDQIKPSNGGTKTIAQPVQQFQDETRGRCSGLTKAGVQCSRTTKNLNGRCYQHQRQ